MDAALFHLLLTAALIGLVLDCNRRVRAIQRYTDQTVRWLDALVTMTHPPLRHPDTQPPLPRPPGDD